ncbi:hypothetical protein [Saccharopolyspora mangrovi]|uniref:AbiV family abortive infection protein n=1 Tax=Saccharopolyspora mangrovi TaxID=3082379 RepID=A0ABU6AKF3_9PSEU|nr:hypothetical protein [Saccharopolyspora sp. S2-29]MEB3371911.1 hypothetical protein [Saccharopolyspora sp. S2-29]
MDIDPSAIMIIPAAPESGDMDADQALACGIGYVAMSSARLEHALRSLLQLLVNDGDLIGPSWILFEGQSANWLRESVKGVLSERDPYYRSWPKETHNRLLDILTRAKTLQELRNAVIHGTWYSADHTPFEEEEDEVAPRSTQLRVDDLPDRARPYFGWNQPGDETLWHCHVSRQWKYNQAREFTTSDVWLLGEKLDHLAASVRATCAAMYPHSDMS